jgi:hypothetical protein
MTVLEFWHPLRSGDVHDFWLETGASVGVIFNLRLFSYDSNCNEGVECMADSRWPDLGSAPLVVSGGLAPPPPPPAPPPPPVDDGCHDGDDDGHHDDHHGHGHHEGRGDDHHGEADGDAPHQDDDHHRPS